MVPVMSIQSSIVVGTRSELKVGVVLLGDALVVNPQGYGGYAVFSQTA